MATDPHLRILHQAAAGTLPKKFEEPDASVVKMFIASEHLTNVLDVTPMDRTGYVEFLDPPLITVKGKEHLRELEARRRASSFLGKVQKYFLALTKSVWGIVTAIFVLVVGGVLVYLVQRLIEE
jgi:hypothetical protein